MDASCKHPVVAVVGPTASGKTALSLMLAERFGGEIISADSMQIYRGLDIGTAKATVEEQARVPHHGIDICDPEQSFSVADFVQLAGGLEREIRSRGRLPILCGGTGLYVQSFLDGVRFAAEKTDSALRDALALELEQRGRNAMYNELVRVDPEAAAAIHPNNTVRVLRALEHYRATGRTLSDQKANSLPAEKPYRSLVICLHFADRQKLYDRIDRRVELMLEDGLLVEVERVYAHRDTYKTAAQAIGYKEFFPYLEGTASLEECTARLKQASRNYAKRQLTWFRRMEGLLWLDAGDPQAAFRAAAAAVDGLINEER